MARAGQVIENPVTGVKLIFHETAHESDGLSWEAEEFLKPFAGKISMAHYCVLNGSGLLQVLPDSIHSYSFALKRRLN